MSTSSFLPEDYIAKRAERRTNVICIALFAVVMASVFGAFLVTNRAWTHVKSEQAMINVRYQEAGQQIQELNELEAQRDEMLHRAELVAALVERVPRSIMLAELINRMPPQLGLIEFEVKSEQRQVRRAPNSPRSTQLSSRHRGQTRETSEDTPTRVEPPLFHVQLAMTGVAPTDLEVSRYLAALNTYSLLDNVSLAYSEQKEFDGRRMRQFRINMELSSEADVRHIEPLAMKRGLRNPMMPDSVMHSPGATDSAAVNPDERN